MAQKKKLVGLALMSLLLLSACSDNMGDKYVTFAKCLTEKGAVMYGAFWCPHCQNQKKMFGEKGFEQIKYVECDPRGENPDTAACEQKKIQGYPTWIFADGTRISGEQSLEELSVRTSCELPKETGIITDDQSIVTEMLKINGIQGDEELIKRRAHGASAQRGEESGSASSEMRASLSSKESYEAVRRGGSDEVDEGVRNFQHFLTNNQS